MGFSKNTGISSGDSAEIDSSVFEDGGERQQVQLATILLFTAFTSAQPAELVDVIYIAGRHVQVLLGLAHNKRDVPHGHKNQHAQIWDQSGKSS
jgi:hypothetical protein